MPIRAFGKPIWGSVVPDLNTPHLLLEDVHGWYGESHVLHGVSFDVRPGETVMLMGRNGAGKTTTLRAIMGMLKARRGRIEVSGSDITRLKSYEVAKTGLAFVPEDRGIFVSLNVDENLNLPPIMAPGGMSIDEIHALFPNLKERRRSPGTKLSGGEQQMLAIGRVLRTGARILLLDEPTEGLAPIIIKKIAEVLTLLKQRGLTVLLVEQNIAFAHEIADRINIIEHGRVVDSLTPQDVGAGGARLERYLGV